MKTIANYRFTTPCARFGARRQVEANDVRGRNPGPRRLRSTSSPHRAPSATPAHAYSCLAHLVFAWCTYGQFSAASFVQFQRQEKKSSPTDTPTEAHQGKREEGRNSGGALQEAREAKCFDRFHVDVDYKRKRHDNPLNRPPPNSNLRTMGTFDLTSPWVHYT